MSDNSWPNLRREKAMGIKFGLPSGKAFGINPRDSSVQSIRPWALAKEPLASRHGRPASQTGLNARRRIFPAQPGIGKRMPGALTSPIVLSRRTNW